MARRKTSRFESLVDLASMLPWWACAVLAALSYFLLRGLAVPAPVTALQPGQMGGLLARTFISGLALAGQYLLPLMFLGGAVVSFWRRRQRNALVTGIQRAESADALDGMSWREFEMLVGEAFRLQGYRVLESGGGGADGGVDVVLTKGTEKFLVQCKQWKALKVGVTVVRELYGVMAARGATGGFIVTSGTFTEDAKDFADGRNITLMDGTQLFGLVRQAQESLEAKAASVVRAGRPPANNAGPPCPVCSSAMVLRTAKRGANARSEFWGCSKYPGCRGTLPAS